MDIGQIILAGATGGLIAGIGVLVGFGIANATADSKLAERRKKGSILVASGLAAALSPFAAALGPSDQLNLVLGLKTKLDVIAAQEGRRLESHPEFKALLQRGSLGDARATANALGAQGIAPSPFEELTRTS